MPYLPNAYRRITSFSHSNISAWKCQSAHFISLLHSSVHNPVWSLRHHLASPSIPKKGSAAPIWYSRPSLFRSIISFWNPLLLNRSGHIIFIQIDLAGTSVPPLGELCGAYGMGQTGRDVHCTGGC